MTTSTGRGSTGRPRARTSPRLQVLLNATTQNFPVDYLAKPDVVTDGGGSNDLTEQIPTEFHRTVVIPYMIFLIRDARGDSSAQQWFQVYERGLKEMQEAVLPPGGSQAYQLPDFFEG